jgi:Protein of unknown function (DUF3047)
LKTLFLVCALFLFIFQASTSPLSLIVLDTDSFSMGHPPLGWQIKVNHGHPDFGACKDNAGACLHLKSANSSFGLERKVDVAPSQMPYLTWRWKVTLLPNGGDFRRGATDDQAAQVLVAFADDRIITYIWDSTAPKGTAQRSTSYPFLHIFAVVCESGATEANQWTQESHNIAEDYQRAFGKPAPRVKGLRLQINSQHTGTVAESYFGEVAFRSSAD